MPLGLFRWHCRGASLGTFMQSSTDCLSVIRADPHQSCSLVSRIITSFGVCCKGLTIRVRVAVPLTPSLANRCLCLHLCYTPSGHWLQGFLQKRLIFRSLGS